MDDGASYLDPLKQQAGDSDPYRHLRLQEKPILPDPEGETSTDRVSLAMRWLGRDSLKRSLGRAASSPRLHRSLLAKARAARPPPGSFWPQTWRSNGLYIVTPRTAEVGLHRRFQESLASVENLLRSRAKLKTHSAGWSAIDRPSNP